MFSQESKLAVLESKINIYEELSREMLAKLESAVDKISEGNTRIAAILAKHDERIEQSVNTDKLIVGMIEDVKSTNTKEHEATAKRIEKIEKDVSELSKFRWQSIAITGVFVTIIGLAAPFIDNAISSGYNEAPQVQRNRR